MCYQICISILVYVNGLTTPNLWALALVSMVVVIDHIPLFYMNPSFDLSVIQIEIYVDILKVSRTSTRVL